MNSLTQMLADYGRIPVLSHEAQLHLARQVRAWLDWEPIEEVPEIVRRRGVVVVVCADPRHKQRQG
jgi:ribosomal protein L36